MDALVIVVAAIFLGVHGGYYGSLADACLKIGTRLEGAIEGTTGFQDAITPPSSNASRLVNWLATIFGIFVSWYLASSIGLIVFIAGRMLSTVLIGATLKSDPPRRHFCKVIYSSLANREVNYLRAGDAVRANATKDIRERFDRSIFAQNVLGP